MGKHKNLTNDTILDLYEYVYRVNVDSTFDGYINALAAANFDDWGHMKCWPLGVFYRS